MGKKNKIRVIALGIIRHGDRLFVSEGYDALKEQTFYRALGGGVEFGESSMAALRREFHEEIQAHLTNIYYLATLENIFTYQGEPGHELIQLYQCDFRDREFYERESIVFQEKKRKKKALWVDIARFESGELLLVPERCLAYL